MNRIQAMTGRLVYGPPEPKTDLFDEDDLTEFPLTASLLQSVGTRMFNLTDEEILFLVDLLDYAPIALTDEDGDEDRVRKMALGIKVKLLLSASVSKELSE